MRLLGRIRCYFADQYLVAPSMPNIVTPSSPTPREIPRKPSYFIRVLDVIVLTSNVCGNGPLSFPLIAFLAFFGSCVVRLAVNESLSTLACTFVLVSVYYTSLGLYRLLVYNRYFDPLLAIPGPKVVKVVC